MDFKESFWKKLKKLLIPKFNNMNIDINKSNEELEKDFENIEFQWIKGENTGGIEEFSHFEKYLDFEFLVFKSGAKLNKVLMEEFVETFPKSNMNMSGLPEMINNQEITNVEPIVDNIIPKEVSKKSNNSSPIYGLLNKQKPNVINLDISLDINLPSKELYSILIESFDNAKEDILEYVMNNLDMEDMKKKLSNSIVNKYYGYPIIEEKVEKVKEINEKGR